MSTVCGRPQGGRGPCGRMWTGGVGSKTGFFVDVINGISRPLYRNSQYSNSQYCNLQCSHTQELLLQTVLQEKISDTKTVDWVECVAACLTAWTVWVDPSQPF